jgi:N6-L-threonylcarbamoyladenine synthase
MLILAIETSCDETSIAFLESDFDGELNSQNFLEYINSFEILAHKISTQVATHAEYGGVIPEIGARLHAEQIHFIFEQTVTEATKNNIKTTVIMNSFQDPQQLMPEAEPKTTFHHCHPELVSGSPTTGSNTSTEKRRFIFNNPKIQQLLSRIDYICVTTEPGLKSALRVGEEFAKTVQFYLNLKLNKKAEIVKVNHLKGHIFSSFYDLPHRFAEPLEGANTNYLGSKTNINDFKLHPSVSYKDPFPHLHLLVSGGNSQLLLVKSPFEIEIIGQTLDDAAGECFDKTARMFGLQYPGGVALARIAGLEKTNYLDFPVSMKNNPELNFSFSGLKTAVRYFVQKNELLKYEEKLSDAELDLLLQNNLNELIDPKLILIKKLCISIQSVITEQLAIKVKKAIKEFEPKSVGVSGGVSANQLLRQKIQNLSRNKTVFVPDLSLTGDNAVMIGLAGAILIKNQNLF